MDKSPVYLKHETGDEFDPQLDFAQFLKEAKTQACHEKSVASSLHASGEAGKQQLGGKTKPNKSWKSSIFPWLKDDKKSSKTIVVEEQQPPPLKSSYSKSKTRRGYVSGPINGIKGCSADRQKRPTSGPLSGLFNQRKRMDGLQMPYISLGQFNNPRELRSYGPVYSVT